MSNLYAMQRANGDWFSFEDDGKLFVPVFHTAHDAFMARLRTVEMLVFSPAALTAQLLNEIVEGETALQFCMISNPFASLKRGVSLQHAELLSLIANEAPPPRRSKWLARPWSPD
jgi:hypothetical protein